MSRYRYDRGSDDGSAAHVTIEQQEASGHPNGDRGASRTARCSRERDVRRKRPPAAVVPAAARDAATGRPRRVAAGPRPHRRRRRAVHGSGSQELRSRDLGRLDRLARDPPLGLVRLPDHGADVRARRPVRGPPATPRTRADRHRAVPGHRDLARLRAGQRRALLELLHLLRLAVLRHRVHRHAARASSAGHRVAARAGGVRAPSAARRLREAHRGGRARAGRPRAAPRWRSSATSR